LRHQNQRARRIPFSETENCLALVTMTCQLLTRIADGS
jgi:hypothetical protein